MEKILGNFQSYFLGKKGVKKKPNFWKNKSVILPTT